MESPTFPALPGIKRDEHSHKKLTQKHEVILQCHVIGMDHTEIGRQIGLSAHAVTDIVNSELGQARVGQLLQIAEIDTADIATQIHLGAGRAIDFLNEIVSNEGDGIGSSKGLRFKAAVEMLRMDGYTPVSRSVSIHANAGVIGEGGMQALLAKGRAVRGLDVVEETPPSSSFDKKEVLEANFEELVPEGS